MLNLQQFYDKYGPRALPGNGPNYLVNSDVPHSLNRTYEAYVTDADGRVQEYSMELLSGVEHPHPTPEEEAAELLVDEAGQDRAREARCEEYSRRQNETLWWGETLDKYYPHPYYPDDEVVAVQVLQDIPTGHGIVKAGTVVPDSEENDDEPQFSLPWYRKTYQADYPLSAVYDMPQYFKPLYEFPE